MKDKLQTMTVAVLFLVGLGITSVALTAIVTRYEGTVDLKVGPNGGQVRIVGQSDPPADKALPPVE